MLVCYTNGEAPGYGGVVYTGYNPLSSWTAEKIIGLFKSSSGVNAGVKATLVPAVKTAATGIVAAKKAAVKTAAVGVVAAKKAAVKTIVVGAAKKGLSSVGSAGFRVFGDKYGGHGNGGVVVAAPVPKITYASLLGRLGGLGKTGLFGSYGKSGAGVAGGVSVAAGAPSGPNGGNIPEPQLVQNGEQRPEIGGYGEEQEKYGPGPDAGEQNNGGEGPGGRQQSYANGGPGLPYGQRFQSGAPSIQGGQQSFGNAGGQFEGGRGNFENGGPQHELGQQSFGNGGVNANFDAGIGGNAGAGFDLGGYDDFSFNSGLGGAQYNQFAGFGGMLPGMQSNLKNGEVVPGGNEPGTRNLESLNGYRNNGGQCKLI